MRLLFGPGFDGSPGDSRSYQSLLADLKSRTAPWARSLARLERPADNREVASPNLAGPTSGRAALLGATRKKMLSATTANVPLKNPAKA